ncbi:ABC transporter ATP-binding protein [Microlunatus sp. GCM10028923]|uniref:ABC transporter ATP-binding protein n=1 Tax=Microlunatus sp. GCM10028923 TaxID=3273400 RepID=UPI003616C622
MDRRDRRGPLRRVLPWVRPYRRDVVIMIVTDVLALGAQMSQPLLIAAMIDGPILHRDPAGLWWYGAAMLGLGLIQTLMYVLRRRAMLASVRLEHDLRVACYGQALRWDPGQQARSGSGHVVARTTGDLRTVGSYFSFVLPYLISTMFTLVFVTAMLLTLNPAMGALVLVAMIPMVALSRTFAHRYEALAVDAGSRTDQLTTAASESVRGIRAIKLYGRRQLMLDRFLAGAHGLRDAELRLMRLFAGFDSVLVAYPILVLAGVVAGGIAAVTAGALSVGGFVAFTAFYFRLTRPVMVAGGLLAQTQLASAATRRVLELLDTEPGLREPRDPQPLPAGSLGVRFDGVVLDDGQDSPIDLEIGPGETVALVGATGSGKSRLAALVPRLADPASGRVSVGGIDVTRLRLAELRGRIGVAFEDAVLFSGSVRENLTAGRAAVGDAELHRILELTRADFVHRLPNGLDSAVEEQGLSLSGGQRQRLALARALVGRPSVLVLDDPISALDVRTEAAIEQELRAVLDPLTVIIVARRLSTARLADRIALLDGARIVDVGSHAELVERSAAYRTLMLGEPGPEAARDD